MEEISTTSPKKSRVIVLIKTTTIILIARECMTLLYAYVTKSNAEYGLINNPSQEFEDRISVIYAWGIGLLIASIIYLAGKTIETLIILFLIFASELTYQLYGGFFEALYLITTPLVLILLIILLFKSIKKQTS